MYVVSNNKTADLNFVRFRIGFRRCFYDMVNKYAASWENRIFAYAKKRRWSAPR